LPPGRDWELAGYGIPENAIDASHMFVDSGQWVDVENGGDPMSQSDLKWATDMVVKDKNGEYHTFAVWPWEDESIEDLYTYMDDWLESEYY
jgi:hypothetical protein